MSFSFGTPKTATGFTLPTTSAPTASAAPTFQFSSNTGAGDATAAAKPTLGLFGAAPAAAATSSAAAAAAPGGGFSFGAAKTSAAPGTGGLSFGSVATTATGAGFGFGVPAATATTTTATVSSAGTTATPLGLNLATSTATTTAAAAAAPTSLGSFLTATTSAPLSFGLTAAAPTTTTAAATTSAPPPTFGFSAAAVTTSTGLQLPTTTTTATSQPTTTTPAAITTTTTTTTVSVLPQTGSLTFAQLEDSINKWTIQMEDQLKIFMNQARQLTAWDRLLVSNGEKIVNISNGLEGIKQQQQQLDHELDFVLSQQKELEDLIVPLEKELAEVPIHDHDRYSIYQIAETLDSQLKQMSDDLNQAIEHINEVAKNQNPDDPISQIAKILNAHMNSLQWIDRNTAQINNHLEQVSKMQEQMINFRT